MRRYKISRYDTRFDKGKEIDVLELTWKVIASKLMQFVVTKETFAQYKSMSSLERLDIKDVGYFVGGEFNPPIRKSFNLVGRDLLCLDLDHLESWDVDEVRETYKAFTHLVHSSHSHSDERPRLRIVFPLSRTVKPEEYEPLARMVASKLDMDWFDDTTYQASRIMFLPSRSTDGDEFSYNHEADVMDPDLFLGMYEDVNDFGSWPRSSRQDLVRPTGGRAEDPFTKPGIIGAFNRAYSIPEAIEMFHLPYVESGQGDGRYTYTAGTSADGAIYYPDDGHLFSHHESDPASGNQHAFDLVRLHKFGSLDDGVDEQTVKMSERPSYRAMVTEFGNDKLVVREMGKTNINDFDDLGPEIVLEGGGEEKKIKRSELTFEYIDGMIKEFREKKAEGDAYDIPKHTGDITLAIAAANLASTEEGILISHLNNCFERGQGPGKKNIQDEVKERRRGLTGQSADADGKVTDIEAELVEHVLNNYFEGGKTIRRISKAFWVFDEGRWAMEDEERVVRKLDKAIIALRVDRPKDFKNLVATVNEKTTTQLASALKALLARRVSELHDAEDPLGLLKRYPLPIINCRNCEIHVNAKGKHQVMDHNPASMLDIRLDVNYDKDADAPEWDRFCDLLFRESLEPEEMKRHLEELLGYIVQYSRWMKHFAIFMGYTDAGKSTIVDLLKGLLGEGYTEAPITMFSEEKRNQFTNMLLLHKLLLVDEERSKAGLLPDGALKSLAEEKAVTTDVKFAGPLNFISRVFPLVVSNQWPRTADIGDAFTRRALVWHFKHELPPEERSDAAKVAMLDNRSGFLNRLLAGIKRLRARGHFDVPAECEEAKQDWLTHCNPMLRFLNTGVKVSAFAPSAECVTPGDLYRHWEHWCSAEGIAERYRIKKSVFWEWMESHGYGRQKGGKGRRYVQRVVELKPIEDDDDDF